MWSHQDLREVYRRAGWKEADFVSKSVSARSAAGNGGPQPQGETFFNLFCMNIGIFKLEFNSTGATPAQGETDYLL